jgi:hypothetical protein
VVRVGVAGVRVDGVAQGLQLRLLDVVGEALVAEDPGQRDHPVALGDRRAVARHEVGRGPVEQHGADSQFGAQ